MKPSRVDEKLSFSPTNSRPDFFSGQTVTAHSRRKQRIVDTLIEVIWGGGRANTSSTYQFTCIPSQRLRRR